MKRVKNNKDVADVWCGMEIQPNAFYEIQSSELSRWQSSSKVIADIAGGDLIVNNGTTDIADIVYALDYLRDNIPSIVNIQEQAPFAKPDYRTKRNASGTIETVNAGETISCDFQLPEELYVYGGEIVYENGLLGDFVSAEVYDKDGLIPAPYRPVVCENYPTVAKYIVKKWVTPGRSEMRVDTYPLNAKITAGLYLRITYTAINSGDPRKFGVNYFLTKKT